MNFKKIFQRKVEESCRSVDQAERSLEEAFKKIKLLKEAKPIDLMLDEIKNLIENLLSLQRNLIISESYNMRSDCSVSTTMMSKREEIYSLLNELRKDWHEMDKR